MKVLVIDDDQINLDLFCLMLSMLDMAAPVPVRHAQAALDWCADHTPDLVVVDYLMPDLDGLTFLRRFRASLDLAVRKATADIVAREHEAIHRLSRAAEFRDADTGFHLSRMAAYSRLIAVQLGLPAAECDLVCDAASMHDIGKVGIADAVLLKPGPLNDEERKIMQRHPQIGADILAGSESPLLQAGAVIAISHHERYDGGGYPHGLAGEAIPLYGRIIAVADVFDALTNARPYKPAWPLERAVEFLRSQKGTHFDPACVEALLHDMDAILAIQRRFHQRLEDAN